MQEHRSRLFGTNGVRGVFGKELTLSCIIDLSYSLASYFKEGPIIIGYDGRVSSPILSKLVRSAVNSAGLDVADAGLIPTPCLQYGAKYLGFRGGIMITASHNPPQYNGIKPCASDGVEISRSDELKVEEIYYTKEFSKVDGLGRAYVQTDVIDSYIESTLQLLDIGSIKDRNFTIVMDTGNGAQALVAPFLLTKLGCKVIIINGNINGNFPGRGSEPTSDNLGVLTNMVRKMKADFGVAYDGDGDRAIFCDDKGTVHFGDKTGALLARHLLRTRHKGTEIVCPINTSMVLTWVVEEERSKVTYTKVGSVDVSREMIKRKAVIGLEENGGFMYGKLNQVRDGALATALILEMLAASKNKRLSDMISSLRNVFQYKSKFVCSTKQLANNIINLCLQHGSPKRVETIDGAKIWVDNETWIMIRPSGTEPIIRVYAESTDKLLLDSKVEEYQRLIINNLER